MRYATWFSSVLLLMGCETTSTQRDYADKRDVCREYSELRVATLSQPGAGKGQRRLLKEFGRCMQREGWGVSGPRTGPIVDSVPPGGTVPGQPNPTPLPPQPKPNKARKTAYQQRSAECAYARHAADHSARAAAMAKQCAAQCKEKLARGAGKRRPAACPPV